MLQIMEANGNSHLMGIEMMIKQPMQTGMPHLLNMILDTVVTRAQWKSTPLPDIETLMKIFTLKTWV